MAKEVPKDRWSLLLWVLQRLSGLFLVVLLFLHIIWLHFVDPESVMTVAGVRLRLQALLFGVTDTLLLGFVVFHAMNGMRSVFYDYVKSPTKRKVIMIFLIVASCALMGYALWAFLPFVLGIQ